MNWQKLNDYFFIRTPMNAVCGMATVLLDSPDLQPDDAKCVEIISKSSKTLLSLINTILDFSKTEAGKAEFRVLYFPPPPPPRHPYFSNPTNKYTAQTVRFA